MFDAWRYRGKHRGEFSYPVRFTFTGINGMYTRAQHRGRYAREYLAYKAGAHGGAWTLSEIEELRAGLRPSRWRVELDPFEWPENRTPRELYGTTRGMPWINLD